jgi:hypothetical protein
MWHSPNQRIRALNNAKQRERERARRPFHVKRVVAHLKIQGPDVPAEDQEPVPFPIRLVLNDLSVKGVGVFAASPLVPGQEVVLTITHPMTLEIRCRVVWCQEFAANSHVLSHATFSYRLGLEFQVSGLEDQINVRTFWDDMCRNYLYSLKAV